MTPGKISSFLKSRASGYARLDPARLARNFFDFTQSKNAKPKGRAKKIEFEISVPLTNAFIPLRVVRTCRLTGVEPRSDYLRYFESTLHDQLSFISIPDSRFDPAELAFCLEGVLLSQPSIDVALFSRVLEVLKTAQENSAHWRPTKPFLRNERGLVLFPLSVEAANALVRSCRLLDDDSRFDRFTGEIIGLLRRFWEWLSARRISLTSNGKKLHGWHSEHVADVDSIQLWDTAQVVEFLLGYRHRLRLHIAHTTLRLARFDVRTPAKPQSPWSARTRKLQTQKGHVFVPRSKGGPISTVVSQFEPVRTLGPYFQTYRRIGEDFVRGWLSGPRVGFSMLLYGPPGTGKTSVAENIADALGFRLITITVSDFLAEGGGAVEARAKMIFEVLEAQADCVILFDEIDELLLGRSSARHSAQETVFKFMTPGMLTKLNNLRRGQRVIFILATNYAYRIDPAIRRTGRIDENYLLLPPDERARKEMLRKFLEKKFKKGPLSPKKIGEKQMTELAKTALFLGYKDIEGAVARVSRRLTPDTSALSDILRDWSRTTSLEFYRSAFSEVVYDTDPIKKEFLPLVHMAIKEDPNHKLPTDFKDKNGKRVFKRAADIKTAAKENIKGARI